MSQQYYQTVVEMMILKKSLWNMNRENPPCPKVMPWVKPCRQLSPMQLFPHSLQWDGEENQKGEVTKIIGWDKSQFTGKARTLYTSQAKQGISSRFPMRLQVLSHPPGKLGSILSRGYLGNTKHTHSKCFPFSPYCPGFFPVKNFTIWSGKSRGSLGVSCVPLPSCLCTSSLLPSVWGEQKRPWLWVNAAQILQKHPFIIKVIFSTNPKYIPIPAFLAWTSAAADVKGNEKYCCILPDRHPLYHPYFVTPPPFCTLPLPHCAGWRVKWCSLKAEQKAFVWSIMLYCTLIQAFEALHDWESSVGKALEPMALEL